MNIKKIISAVSALAILSSISSVTAFAELGDLNSDGNIDAIDASNILTAYAMVSTGHDIGLSQQQVKDADVNADGDVNAIDASYLLSYYAYKAVTSDADSSLSEYIEHIYTTEQNTVVYPAELIKMNALEIKNLFKYLGYEEGVTGNYGGLCLYMFSRYFDAADICFEYNESEQIRDSDKPILICVYSGSAAEGVTIGNSVKTLDKVKATDKALAWNMMEEGALITMTLSDGIDMIIEIENYGSAYDVLMGSGTNPVVTLGEKEMNYLVSQGAKIKSVKISTRR